MTRLRSVKPATVIEAFENLVISVKRRKDSHVSITKLGVERSLVVMERGDLAIG